MTSQTRYAAAFVSITLLAFTYLLYSSHQTSNWDKYVERTSVPKDFSKSDHEKIEDLIEEVHLLENKFLVLERKLGTEDPEIENDVISDPQLPQGGVEEVKSPEKIETIEKKDEAGNLEKKVRPDYLPVSKCPELTEAVDAVYTWVNGSDPEFVNSLKETDLGMKTHKDDTHNQRFADFNQLKYSFRSIEMYAPWIRNIFIVTNGQVPSWLKLNHPRVEVIPHSEIFQKKSDLPTFNSMAIEVHLHKIPGLSRRFIYLNDDFAFQAPVCMSDFWTSEKGYKVYKNGPIGKKVLEQKCPEDCVSVKMGDGTCDQECNTIACLWDGDDCDGVLPEGGERDKRPTFYQAIDFVNVLYERTLTEGSERNWLPHVPFMFDIDIMTDMQKYFKVYFDVTSRHKKRQKNDMQPEFSYAHWLREAPKSSHVKVDKEKYKYQLIKGGPVAYISYRNDMKKNKPAMDRQIKSKTTKFLCVNDLMDHSKPESTTAKLELEKFYETLYPHKSEFEL